VSFYAGLLRPPNLAVYAGTKVHHNAFSISLAREMNNMDVISLLTGSVNTESNKNRFLLCGLDFLFESENMKPKPPVRWKQ